MMNTDSYGTYFEIRYAPATGTEADKFASSIQIKRNANNNLSFSATYLGQELTKQMDAFMGPVDDLYFRDAQPALYNLALALIKYGEDNIFSAEVAKAGQASGQRGSPQPNTVGGIWFASQESGSSFQRVIESIQKEITDRENGLYISQGKPKDIKKLEKIVKLGKEIKEFLSNFEFPQNNY